MFFIILGTYTRWTFIIFFLVQRIILLIFRCHTVTHGTDLRRSPPLRNSEAAAVQQRRVKDETLKAEASLPTLMATHNLPLGTLIFDGFLPILTLFTTF